MFSHARRDAPRRSRRHARQLAQRRRPRQRRYHGLWIPGSRTSRHRTWVNGRLLACNAQRAAANVCNAPRMFTSTEQTLTIVLAFPFSLKAHSNGSFADPFVPLPNVDGNIYGTTAPAHEYVHLFLFGFCDGILH